MKLTTGRLKRMIREELESLNQEAFDVGRERMSPTLQDEKDALKRQITDKLNQYAFGAGMGSRDVDEIYAALDDAQTVEDLQMILNRLNNTMGSLGE